MDANAHALSMALLLLVALTGVGAQNKCYWSPQGVQCDDHLAGPSGMAWSYNGPGHAGSGSPGFPPNFNNPPISSGCRNGLPFGLNNCICDGDVAGLAAGTRACQRVKAQCGGFQQFSSVDFLESLQQVCDAFTQQACVSTAGRVAANDRDCRDLLRDGNRACSRDRARQLYEAEASRYCTPLSFTRGEEEEEEEEKDSGSSDDESSDERDKSSDDSSDDSSEKDSSDAPKDGEDGEGCSSNRRKTAEGAGRVACRAVLERCANNAWGPKINPDPPCDTNNDDEFERCRTDAWDWVEDNNRYCWQLLNQGSTRCPVSVTARVEFRRATINACQPTP